MALKDQTFIGFGTPRIVALVPSRASGHNCVSRITDGKASAITARAPVTDSQQTYASQSFSTATTDSVQVVQGGRCFY